MYIYIKYHNEKGTQRYHIGGVFQIRLVVARPSLHVRHLHLRRDETILPPPESRRLARARNLLLDAKENLIIHAERARKSYKSERCRENDERKRESEICILPTQIYTEKLTK